MGGVGARRRGGAPPPPARAASRQWGTTERAGGGAAARPPRAPLATAAPLGGVRPMSIVLSYVFFCCMHLSCPLGTEVCAGWHDARPPLLTTPSRTPRWAHPRRGGRRGSWWRRGLRIRRLGVAPPHPPPPPWLPRMYPPRTRQHRPRAPPTVTRGTRQGHTRGTVGGTPRRGTTAGRVGGGTEPPPRRQPLPTPPLPHPSSPAAARRSGVHPAGAGGGGRPTRTAGGANGSKSSEGRVEPRGGVPPASAPHPLTPPL